MTDGSILVTGVNDRHRGGHRARPPAPVFNLADTFITLGAAVLIRGAVRAPKPQDDPTESVTANQRDPAA